MFANRTIVYRDADVIKTGESSKDDWAVSVVFLSTIVTCRPIGVCGIYTDNEAQWCKALVQILLLLITLK